MYLGIDIGGTNIKIALVKPTGQVAARGLIATEPSEGAAAAFRRVAEALPTLGAARGVQAVGVGCAGLISRDTGTVVASPNLKAWEGRRLTRIAEKLFGVFTIVDNDATCAAWGEFIRGENHDCEDLVFVTMGTGIGGGVVSDGRIVRGASNFAGELGHTCVVMGGRRCHCGARGCVEAYAGAYGMLRTARELLAERRSRYLTRWTEVDGRRLTPALIAAAAEKGDAVGRAVMRHAGEHLGTAVASLINIFNPKVVVLGGGVSASFELFAPHIRRAVRLQAFPQARALVRIERSRLGNDATVVGAAMFARDARRKRI